MTSCDVVIVGAGPAGALLGYLLASRGIDAVILEKRALPRYKLCGGGLTERAVRLIPFPIDGLAEDAARTAHIGVDYRTVHKESLDGTTIKMVMRDRFDAFLCRQASDAGARIRSGESFRSFSGSTCLSISTDTGNIRTRILAGADGVNSRTAKALGLQIKAKRMAAVQGEVYPPASLMLDRFKGQVHFDFGVVPRGYGWVFPKSDHLSVGVLTTAGRIQNLNGWFRRYLSGKGLADTCRIDHFRGHPIPHSPKKESVFANRRGLVIGDAAGVTDPITGEGIYHAFKGAWLAAGAITAALATGDRKELLHYNRDFKREILDELSVIHRIAPIFYRCPRLIKWFFAVSGSRAGRAYLEIAAGRKTYNAVFREWFHSTLSMGAGADPT